MKNEIESMFGVGEYNAAYQQYFSKKSFLNPLIAFPNSDDLSIVNVTFEKGSYNAYHIHSNHQILICTDGEGWYQEFGQKAIKLHRGDVVDIKPGIKHWHGASKDSSFAHIAIAINSKTSHTEWCEMISEKEYLSL
ncbi:MAG: cupin domain-containing protein [Bacilli bacterium]|jgi:4-carboxymuconolactone decarboxylase|nr:cupin domain-containing protein [Bacilli bacterium]